MEIYILPVLIFLCAHKLLGYHEIKLKSTILEVVAQVSSRVFLGDTLCRNPAWLKITVEYTTNVFVAADSLRQWPRPIRPIVHWLLPSCRKLRAQVREARAIITPFLQERRISRAHRAKEGKTQEKKLDAMEWMEETAKGRRYDAAAAQLSFSVVAIHTTTDLISQVIFDICEQEGLIQALRTEAISVISENGWTKSALYKLKLMDSVVKESQRLKPSSIGSFI
jgi:cytochrome P450